MSAVTELWLPMDRAPTDGRWLLLKMDVAGDEVKPRWRGHEIERAYWGELETISATVQGFITAHGIAGLYDPIGWRPDESDADRIRRMVRERTR